MNTNKENGFLDHTGSPESVMDYLPAIQSVEFFSGSEDVVRLTLVIDRELDRQEIGRLLLVDGEYRLKKIQAHFFCPPIIISQLKKLELDRLLLLEPVKQ